MRRTKMRRGAWHRLAATIVTLAFGLALPRAATAGGGAAEDLIKEGVGLRRKGDDQGALQRFEQAYQLEKSPRALAQMGLAEQALGRWVAAYEHLTEALGGKSDPWIGKNRGAISEALNTVGEHVGRLEILGGSANAEVRIDGVVRGTLPLAAPLAISTGTITIDLSAPGFVPQQRTTVVRARQTTRESFEPLVAIAGRAKAPAAVAAVTAPPAGERVAATEPSAAGAPPAPATITAQPEAAGGQPSALRSGAKWIAWGLGAAALGLGVFGYVRQSSAGDDFNKDCAIGPDGTIQSLTGVPLPTCRDRQDRVDANFRLEVIGLIGAGALAAAGLVLWLTEPKPSGAGATAWTCAPGLTSGSGAWLGCALRF